MPWDMLTVKKKKSLDKGIRGTDIKELSISGPIPLDPETSRPLPRMNSQRVLIDSNLNSIRPSTGPGPAPTPGPVSAFDAMATPPKKQNVLRKERAEALRKEAKAKEKENKELRKEIQSQNNTQGRSFGSLFSRKRSKSLLQKEPDLTSFDITEMPRFQPSSLGVETIDIARPKTADPSVGRNVMRRPPPPLTIAPPKTDPEQDSPTSAERKQKRIPPPRPRRSTIGEGNPPAMAPLRLSLDKQLRVPNVTIDTPDLRPSSSSGMPSAKQSVGPLPQFRMSRFDFDNMLAKEGIHGAAADQKWRQVLSDVAGADPFSGQPRVQRFVDSDRESSTSEVLLPARPDLQSEEEKTPTVQSKSLEYKPLEDPFSSKAKETPTEESASERHGRSPTVQTFQSGNSIAHTGSRSASGSGSVSESVDRTLVEDTPPKLPIISHRDELSLDTDIMAQFQTLTDVIKEMESSMPPELMAAAVATRKMATEDQKRQAADQMRKNAGSNWKTSRRSVELRGPALGPTIEHQNQKHDGTNKRVDELERELHTLRSRLANFENQRRQSMLQRSQLQEYAMSQRKPVKSEAVKKVNRVEPTFPSTLSCSNKLAKQYRDQLQSVANTRSSKQRYVTLPDLHQSLLTLRSSFHANAPLDSAHMVVPRIQAMLRGRLVREKIRLYRMSYLAAMRIQAAWRGYYERHHLHPHLPNLILRRLCTTSARQLHDTSIEITRLRAGLDMFRIRMDKEAAWRRKIENDLQALLRQQHQPKKTAISGTDELSMPAFAWLDKETQGMPSANVSPRGTSVAPTLTNPFRPRASSRASSRVPSAEASQASNSILDHLIHPAPRPSSNNTHRGGIDEAPITSPSEATAAVFTKRPPPPGPLPAFPPPPVHLDPTDTKTDHLLGLEDPFRRGSPSISLNDDPAEDFFSAVMSVSSQSERSISASSSLYGGSEMSRGNSTIGPNEFRQLLGKDDSTAHLHLDDQLRDRRPSGASSVSSFYAPDRSAPMTGHPFSDDEPPHQPFAFPAPSMEDFNHANNRGSLYNALGLTGIDTSKPLMRKKLPSFVSTSDNEDSNLGTDDESSPTIQLKHESLRIDEMERELQLYENEYGNPTELAIST